MNLNIFIEQLIKVANSTEIEALIRALLILVLMDYATGFIKSIYTKNNTKGLESRVVIKGTLRKLTMFLLLITAEVVGEVFGYGQLFLSSCAILCIIAQVISIIENVGEFIKFKPLINKMIEKLKYKEK